MPPSVAFCASNLDRHCIDTSPSTGMSSMQWRPYGAVIACADNWTWTFQTEAKFCQAGLLKITLGLQSRQVVMSRDGKARGVALRWCWAASTPACKLRCTESFTQLASALCHAPPLITTAALFFAHRDAQGDTKTRATSFRIIQRQDAESQGSCAG